MGGAVAGPWCSRATGVFRAVGVVGVGEGVWMSCPCCESEVAPFRREDGTAVCVDCGAVVAWPSPEEANKQEWLRSWQVGTEG